MQIESRTDWLKWRKQGIGGSDMPIVLGLSPWSTPLKLYEEKLSEEIKENSNYQTELGNEAETKIRSLFELMHGKEFPPALCVMEEHSFLRTSLDGRSECKTEIIEIKLSGKDDYESAKVGKVPDKYYPQVQHNLMVSGAEICYFMSYPFSEYESKRHGPLVWENLAVVQVGADKNYQSMLIREGIKFWDHILKKKPPIPTDKDYKPLVGLSKEAKKWLSNKEKIEKLESEQDELKKIITQAAERQGHSRFICAGIRIRQESRAGSINYKSIPVLKGMDLEAYRGDGSVFWKMEPIAKKE